MPDILIRGMEMPESCSECYFCTYGFCGRLNRYVEDSGRIDRCCPLIELPPHGRLIDADEFVIRITELVRKAKADGFDLGEAWYTAFIRHIDLAPTVIPAEGKEET